MSRVFEACLTHYHGRDREVTGGAVCRRLSQSLPVGLRTGEGLARTGGGRRGLVEEEWSNCQSLKHKLVMKTGEDCRYLWVFWSGLVVCWSAGPGGSAPRGL